jgi:hypothetical protein
MILVKTIWYDSGWYNLAWFFGKTIWYDFGVGQFGMILPSYNVGMILG